MGAWTGNQPEDPSSRAAPHLYVGLHQLFVNTSCTLGIFNRHSSVYLGMGHCSKDALFLSASGHRNVTVLARPLISPPTTSPNIVGACHSPLRRWSLLLLPWSLERPRDLDQQKVVEMTFTPGLLSPGPKRTGNFHFFLLHKVWLP